MGLKVREGRDPNRMDCLEKTFGMRGKKPRPRRGKAPVVRDPPRGGNEKKRKLLRGRRKEGGAYLEKKDTRRGRRQALAVKKGNVGK